MKSKRLLAWATTWAFLLFVMPSPAQQNWDGKPTEITSTPKANRSKWVLRFRSHRDFQRDASRAGSVYLHQVKAEQRPGIQPAPSLIPEAEERQSFVSSRTAWRIRRGNVSTAFEILNKFSAWEAMARKAGLRDVSKMMGILPDDPEKFEDDPEGGSGPAVHFQAYRERGFTRYGVAVERFKGDKSPSLLGLDDVDAILELLAKVPTVEAKSTGKKGAARPDRGDAREK